MISTPSSFSSSASFLGSKVVMDGRYSQSSSLSFSHRPMRISASCASTVERPASSTSSSSLYEVLGIRMEATCQEIKTAYRKLARVVHPDVQTGQASADQFLKIHEAYSTLSDPAKRADYDRQLFGRRRPASSSYSYPMSYYGSEFSVGSTGPRTWETDQCW
ncbi:hypothetical protein UlMin_034079 [Ulmus minor]